MYILTFTPPGEGLGRIGEVKTVKNTLQIWEHVRLWLFKSSCFPYAWPGHAALQTCGAAFHDRWWFLQLPFLWWLIITLSGVRDKIGLANMNGSYAPGVLVTVKNITAGMEQGNSSCQGKPITDGCMERCSLDCSFLVTSKPSASNHQRSTEHVHGHYDMG